MNQWGNIPDWIYSASSALMQSLKTADSMTFYHCLRVGEMARRLAQSAGLNEYEQKVAQFAGMFHDIGKMGISKDVIWKPGRLTEDEYKQMKNHSIMSEVILTPFEKQSDFFKDILPGVRGHHERVDGTGYPDKLMDEQIPVIARVILIVDTVDAMSQNRAYRKGLPMERVFAELKQFKGTQFDAQLVQVFLESYAFWTPLMIEEETNEKLLKLVA